MPRSTSSSPWNARIAAVLIINLVLWASAFVAIRAGLEGYSPGELALFRHLIASTVLGLYLVFRRLPLPARRDLPRVALIGAVGFAFYSLAINAGETRVQAGPASFVLNTSPIFTAILASKFLGERLRPMIWLGLTVSMVGTGIIAFGEAKGFSLEPALLLVLLAAILQSGYFVLQKPLLERYSAVQLNAACIIAGTILLLPFLPGLVEQVGHAPLRTTSAAVYLGVFASAIGYVMWAYLSARMPVSRTATFLYCIPFLATFIGWIWLSEVPSVFSFVGGCVAVIGVVLANRLSADK